MSVDKEAQGSFFAPDEYQSEVGSAVPTPLMVLRYSGHTAVDESVQLSLDGMPKDPIEQLADEVLPPRTNRELELLAKDRSSFTPIMFPEFWGIDTREFGKVSEDAYALSDPKYMTAKLRQRTPKSMREVEFGNWVLLNPGEHEIILNVPEMYAAKAETKARNGLASAFRRTDEQEAANIRAGAHALDSWIEPMENLRATYAAQAERLRQLRRGLIHPIQSPHDVSGMDIRLAATTAREGMRDVLSTIGIVERWSKATLHEVQVGLDMRLTAGRGRQRLEEKKGAWISGIVALGKYTVAKQTLVEDRLARIAAEQANRLPNKDRQSA